MALETTELPIAQGSGNEMAGSASNGCTLRLEAQGKTQMPEERASRKRKREQDSDLNETGMS